MKKTNKIMNEKNPAMWMTLVIVGCFFVSFWFFFTGLHNIDNAYNMRWLSCEYDTEFYDIANNGDIMTYTEAYNSGVRYVVVGSLMLAVSSILTALTMAILERFIYE